MLPLKPKNQLFGDLYFYQSNTRCGSGQNIPLLFDLDLTYALSNLPSSCHKARSVRFALDIFFTTMFFQPPFLTISAMLLLSPNLMGFVTARIKCKVTEGKFELSKLLSVVDGRFFNCHVTSFSHTANPDAFIGSDRPAASTEIQL